MTSAELADALLVSQKVGYEDVWDLRLSLIHISGYQMDEISELYFAQARRYDSRTGRFVSEDLIKGFPEMPL